MILPDRNLKETKFNKLFNMVTEDLSITAAQTTKTPEQKIRTMFPALNKKINCNSLESTIRRLTQSIAWGRNRSVETVKMEMKIKLRNFSNRILKNRAIIWVSLVNPIKAEIILFK